MGKTMKNNEEDKKNKKVDRIIQTIITVVILFGIFVIGLTFYKSIPKILSF